MESQQTFTFSVDINFNRDQREAIAEDVIDFIRSRTDRGLDKNNRPFRRYSKSYSESLDFKIAGKSRNNVDLQLTGDMIGDLQIINVETAGFITIGYERGSDENDRAAWQRNNTRPTHPKRDFLGITDKDLKNILRRYNPVNERELITNQRIEREAQSIIDSFLRGFTNNDQT